MERGDDVFARLHDLLVCWERHCRDGLSVCLSVCLSSLVWSVRLVLFLNSRGKQLNNEQNAMDSEVRAAEKLYGN